VRSWSSAINAVPTLWVHGVVLHVFRRGAFSREKPLF
jgi:hypothetical protein